ncbi:MAG: hypothetical protein ACC631_06765 [Halocynthiibacter sp.]
MAALEVPEGEEILAEGRSDPALYRREALVSLVAGLAFLLILILVWRPGTALLVALLIAAGYGAFRLLLVYWHNHNMRWAMTRRAIYFSNRAPVPHADITMVRGSSANIWIRQRGQRPFAMLGVQDAIELRHVIRKMMRESRR